MYRYARDVEGIEQFAILVSGDVGGVIKIVDAPKI